MSTGTIIQARDLDYAVTTSYATGIAIASITNATEALVNTVAAHGLTGVQVVKLAGVVGMTELNGAILVAEVVDLDTLKLTKYNTLNSPTYVSGGTASPAVFTNFCELTGWEGQSGSTPEVDKATWCDAGSKIVFGKPDHGSFTLNYNQAVGTVADAIEQSRIDSSAIVFRIGFKSYPFKYFDIGTVTQSSSGVSDANSGTWEGSCTVRRAYSPLRVTPV